MSASDERFILTLSCPDTVGIVAAVTGELAAHAAPITEVQHLIIYSSNFEPGVQYRQESRSGQFELRRRPSKISILGGGNVNSGHSIKSRSNNSVLSNVSILRTRIDLFSRSQGQMSAAITYQQATPSIRVELNRLFYLDLREAKHVL